MVIKMTDINYVKELLALFENSSAGVLDLTDGEFKLRLEKAAPAPAPVLTKPEQPCAELAPSAAEQTLDFNNLREIKSPMVGIFYTSPAPGEKPFVERGSKVKKGDVLCIVEAMKLLNEITSDYDGEIADVCVSNGQVVEYGQVLFKIY
jgi:acetyl-CoA carboxylase biotin carboxyl carrier protein